MAGSGAEWGSWCPAVTITHVAWDWPSGRCCPQPSKGQSPLHLDDKGTWCLTRPLGAKTRQARI